MNSKPQLLIIDNNVSILGLLSNLLRDDYEVVTRYNPFDAYNWLQDGNHPALTIIDQTIADAEGFSFVRNLKISGLYRDMPVILLSSAPGAEAAPKPSRDSANALFSKPFDPVKLKKAIRQLITSPAHAA